SAVVDFTSSDRVRKDTGVRAKHVADAQDTATLMEVHEEAERQILVLEFVVPPPRPVWLNGSEYGKRSLLRQAVREERKPRRAVLKHGIAKYRSVRLTGARFHRCAPSRTGSLTIQMERREPRCERNHVALVMRVAERCV